MDDSHARRLPGGTLRAYVGDHDRGAHRHRRVIPELNAFHSARHRTAAGNPSAPWGLWTQALPAKLVGCESIHGFPTQTRAGAAKRSEPQARSECRGAGGEAPGINDVSAATRATATVER